MVRFGFASCGKQVPYSLLGGQGKVTFTNGTRPDFKALPRRFVMSRQAAMRIPTRYHENPDKRIGVLIVFDCVLLNRLAEKTMGVSCHGMPMPVSDAVSAG